MNKPAAAYVDIDLQNQIQQMKLNWLKNAN